MRPILPQELFQLRGSKLPTLVIIHEKYDASLLRLIAPLDACLDHEIVYVSIDETVKEWMRRERIQTKIPVVIRYPAVSDRYILYPSVGCMVLYQPSIQQVVDLTLGKMDRLRGSVHVREPIITAKKRKPRKRKAK